MTLKCVFFQNVDGLGNLFVLSAVLLSNIIDKVKSRALVKDNGNTVFRYCISFS